MKCDWPLDGEVSLGVQRVERDAMHCAGKDPVAQGVNRGKRTIPATPERQTRNDVIRPDPLAVWSQPKQRES